MTQNVEISIPYNAMALSRAADMLQHMAADLTRISTDRVGEAITTWRETAEEQNNEGDLVDNSSAHSNGVPADAPSVFGTNSPATDGRLDHKGVVFDDAYCANAADPFYGTGKNAGQWKKKRGVDDVTYNTWYTSQLGSDSAPDEEEVVDTAAAFGGGAATQQAPTAPKDAGGLLTWASEKQTSGSLTVDDIQACYAECGIAIGDLFPPTDPAAVAQHVTNLYNAMFAKAGA